MIDPRDIELARNVDIRELWTQLGLRELPMVGNVFAPWRPGEKSPSVQVGGGKNIVTDYGGEGATLDTIGLVRRVRNCGFTEAVGFILGRPVNGHAAGAPINPVEQWAGVRILPGETLKAFEAAAHEREVRLPERDDKGEVIGHAYRRGDGNPYTGGNKQRFEKGERRGLIYAPEILDAKPGPDAFLVLAEGWPDTLRLHACGLTVIGLPSATLGREVLRNLQRLIARLGFKRVVIFYDPNPAGLALRDRVGRFLAALGVEYAFVIPDGDRDTDDRLRHHPDAPTEARRLAAEAIPLRTGDTDLASSDAKSDSEAGGSAGAKACETHDPKGNPIPLGVAQAIRRNRPDLVSVAGDFWQFTGKVFEPVDPTEIDADSVKIIGGRARRSNLGDVRHLLAVDAFQPAVFFDWAEFRNFIHVQNGALDVPPLTLHPHNAKYRARNLLPVDYDPKATCPRFSAALVQWLPDDPGARDSLVEWLGYCLVPDTTQERALFLVGEGANGKGRYIRVLENLLGKANVAGLPLSSLRADRTFPTAALVGKLVNIAPESELSADLDEGWLKSLISGDTLEIERKGRDPFPFRNVARFIIQSNNPPHINDKSNGWWRRLIVVRFSRTFVEGERDTELDFKLAQELPGILNLALAGLHRLAERGRFEITPAMAADLDSYRKECNPLATWRDECLVEHEPDWAGRPVWLSCATAYDDYRTWCKANGHTPYARAKFTRELKRLGVEQDVARDDLGRNFKAFLGVKLA